MRENGSQLGKKKDKATKRGEATPTMGLRALPAPSRHIRSTGQRALTCVQAGACVRAPARAGKEETDLGGLAL